MQEAEDNHKLGLERAQAKAKREYKDRVMELKRNADAHSAKKLKEAEDKYNSEKSAAEDKVNREKLEALEKANAELAAEKKKWKCTVS
ncbi:hypothetical protein DPMN_077184 [Dreissena polymorpha]|uniref:Uncharacterized protein n=2 Tax=Dreissena polymorpha TaxID=45954 RepID=A0A9D3YK05_DREPO|nr:hypothetical protein DPMN_077184 [Dreissena polymorpha]